MNLYNELKTHGFYVVLALVCVFGFRSWLQEHEARLQADAAVKTAEATVKSLQERIAATDAAATKAVGVVQAQVKAVHTTAQAIAAIPDLSSVPLNPRLVPNLPTAVTVEAIPLFRELAQCKVDKIQLDACGSDLANEKAIVTQKNNEIVALKEKPKFWKRVKAHLKDYGIGAVGAIAVLAKVGAL